MARSFGYLNESNPMLIGENEAQKMVNCSIERGWIEYKAYDVSDDGYGCVTNRRVVLPNLAKTVLKIENEKNSYAMPGRIMTDNGGSYGIKALDVTDAEVIARDLKDCGGMEGYFDIDGYYCNVKSSLTVYGRTLDQPTTDENGVEIHNKSYDGGFASSTLKLTAPSATFANVSYGKNNKRMILKSLKADGNELAKDCYSILSDETDFPTVVFNEPIGNITEPGETKTKIELEAEWYFLCGKGFLITEPCSVFYAFTRYDNMTGAESPPITKSVEITEADLKNSIGAKIITLKFSEAIKEDWNFRVYRMGFGGSEYLLDDYSKAIGSYVEGDFGGYIDLTNDDELGELLETEGDTTEYLEKDCVNCIAVHNGMLFIGTEEGFLYYSKPNRYDQFRAENFYSFSEPVVDICKYDSNLAVFTVTKSYIVYGAGTDGVVISEIDWETKHHIQNCTRSVYNKLVGLVSDFEPFDSRRSGIILFNHRYARDISLRVRDSLRKGLAHSVDDSRKDLANRNSVIENRYYVAELRCYDERGNLGAFSIVYDVIADGFCIADRSRSGFVYRTREFSGATSPTPFAQYHKGIYVKARGSFRVNIYMDGEEAVSFAHIETDNSNPMRLILHNIPNKRHSTFSVEFEGLSEKTQIHDWQVYE